MTDKINDGGPAFPLRVPTKFNVRTGAAVEANIFPGMSLRDWFAAQALGLGFDWTNVHEDGGHDEAATVAYEVADAMLKAREVKADD